MLAALIGSEHSVVGVVTPPDRPSGRGRARRASPLAELAGQAGFTLLRPERARGDGFLRSIAELSPDVLLVASFGTILDQPVLDLAPHGALNVHASLLPRHRGASPIQHSILAGDGETGVSIQRIVLALDRGDVLLQRRLAIGPAETCGELLERLASLGASAAMEALDEIAAGRAVFTPQDEAAATWAPLLEKADGVLDFTRPATELARRVRAFTPWPGARTHRADGQALGVVGTRVCDGVVTAGSPPGSLVDDAGGRFLVATGEGTLEFLSVRPAGKGEMEGAAYLRGARLAKDEVLGA